MARQLDAEGVQALFAELSERLAAAGATAHLFVVGGAAMALAYDHDRSTRDVDALFEPAPEVRRIAEEMSAGHGLDPDWLNDAAKGYLPGDDAHPRIVFESESLLVQIPSPEYLLAMKLFAVRDDRDIQDAAVLCNTLGYTSAAECTALLASAYPTGLLLPKHRYLADDVAARALELRIRAGIDGPDTQVRAELRRREHRLDATDPFSDPFGPGADRDRPEPPGRGL